MKQNNNYDNSVKLPWTIYKGFNVNLNMKKNNVNDMTLNENIPGMWY